MSFVSSSGLGFGSGKKRCRWLELFSRLNSVTIPLGLWVEQSSETAITEEPEGRQGQALAAEKATMRKPVNVNLESVWLSRVLSFILWQNHSINLLSTNLRSYMIIIQPLSKEWWVWDLFTFLFFFSPYLLAMLHGMWDLSSPTKDWTYDPCLGSMES